MATYGAEYLRRISAAVADFEEAFEAWMSTQIESDFMESRGLLPTVHTAEDADPDKVRRLELQVAEAAGVAIKAVTVTGALFNVQGMGLVDPIANWSLMSSPKSPFSPRDLRITIANVKGRLTAMLIDAEAADDSALPAFSPAQLHPVIWAAASTYWSVHRYRVAVREAGEGLALHWKARLGRNDVGNTTFWQQTLSVGQPEPGRPKLVWPGQPDNQTVKSMRGGLEPLAKSLTNLATGLNLTVRNVTTHTQEELSEQDAMERLSAYSYLARLLDHCEVQQINLNEPTPRVRRSGDHDVDG